MEMELAVYRCRTNRLTEPYRDPEVFRFRDIFWTIGVLFLLGCWISWAFQLNKYIVRQTPAEAELEERLEKQVSRFGQRLVTEAKALDPYLPEQFFEHLKQFEMREKELKKAKNSLTGPTLILIHWRDQLVFIRDEKWRDNDRFDWEALDRAREKYEKWRRAAFPQEYSYKWKLDWSSVINQIWHGLVWIFVFIFRTLVIIFVGIALRMGIYPKDEFTRDNIEALVRLRGSFFRKLNEAEGSFIDDVVKSNLAKDYLLHRSELSWSGLVFALALLATFIIRAFPTLAFDTKEVKPSEQVAQQVSEDLGSTRASPAFQDNSSQGLDFWDMIQEVSLDYLVLWWSLPPEIVHRPQRFFKKKEPIPEAPATLCIT